MITIVMDILPVLYYEKMVGYMPLSFADLVFADERIEACLRKGKFNYVSFANPGNRGLGRSGERKKEGEPHVVAAVPAWPNFPIAPVTTYPSAGGRRGAHRCIFQERIMRRVTTNVYLRETSEKPKKVWSTNFNCERFGSCFYAGGRY